MPVVRIVTDVVDMHVEQPALPGALKNTGFKIIGENLWQEGKHLELHD
jgi:hypothetical protein